MKDKLAGLRRSGGWAGVVSLKLAIGGDRARNSAGGDPQRMQDSGFETLDASVAARSR